jgi:hypothetical protein
LDGVDSSAGASARVSSVAGPASCTGCVGIRAACAKFGIGIGGVVGACRTEASSVPVPESSFDCFLLAEFEACVFACALLSCRAPLSCSTSSKSVRLSKTFLNGVALGASAVVETNRDDFEFNSAAFESSDFVSEGAGRGRAAGAGAETITAQLMQVRGHNRRFRLSAR